MGVMIRGLWAWVELNYRPHAYQAGLYEREFDSEIPIRLPFTNTLLRTSRIREHLAHLNEYSAHLNGHHNGHHHLRRLSQPLRQLGPDRAVPGIIEKSRFFRWRLEARGFMASVKSRSLTSA